MEKNKGVWYVADSRWTREHNDTRSSASDAKLNRYDRYLGGIESVVSILRFGFEH